MSIYKPFEFATDLVRSKTGDTIHKVWCGAAGKTIPWTWAADKTTAECLQLALDNERPHEGRFHVYGGLSANERRMLVRKAAAA